MIKIEIKNNIIDTNVEGKKGTVLEEAGVMFMALLKLVSQIDGKDGEHRFMYQVCKIMTGDISEV